MNVRFPGFDNRVGVLDDLRSHVRHTRQPACVLPPQALALMPKPLWAPWRLEYIEQADELDRCIFCDPEEELLVHRGQHVCRCAEQVPVLVPATC